MLKYKECKNLFKQLKRKNKEKDVARKGLIEWNEFMEEMNVSVKQAVEERKAL